MNITIAACQRCRHCGEPVYLCSQGCCADNEGDTWIHLETEELACELPGPLLTAEPPDEYYAGGAT
jgi:hypothetical protein